MRNKLGILLLISAIISTSSIIKSQCKPQVISFKPGEELYYDIVYNWGFIWVDAGRVQFKVAKEVLNSKPVYHFSGVGVSLKKHDWFFKVRDYYHSWTDLDLRPIKYSRNTSEDGYDVRNYYYFDHPKKNIYTDTWNSEKGSANDTLKMPNCIFDIMTAVYYARSIDFDKLSINQKVPISMVIDNEIFNLYGKYLGKETIKTREKKRIKCLKFSMLLVEGTIFKGGEDMHIWVSDDVNRVPVLVEAKVLVGSVKALLKKGINTKVPVDFGTK